MFVDMVYQWEFHILCIGAFLFGTGGFYTGLLALYRTKQKGEDDYES